MDKSTLQQLEEEVRQLRIKRMKYHTTKRKAEQERAFKEIKDGAIRIFKKYSLNNYDAAFLTSSMHEDTQIFHDLENVIYLIKEEIEE